MKTLWDHLGYELGDRVFNNLRFNDEQIRLISEGLREATTVVDLCTGFGNLAKALVDQGKTVYGVDLSSDSIDYVTKKIGRPNQFYGIQADVNRLPLDDESVDGVSCASSLDLLNLDSFVSEIYRVVKPSGMISVTGYLSANGEVFIEKVKEELIEKIKEGQLEFSEEEAVLFEEVPDCIPEDLPFDSPEKTRDAFQRQGLSILKEQMFSQDTGYFILAQKPYE